MMTNAQAALIAAASTPRDPNAISYSPDTTRKLAAQYKQWLDEQDKADGRSDW